MLYILWALLNLGLILFFISICFRATKLIREKLGLFASMIFVFGLLAFAENSGRGRNSNVSDRQTNSIRKWEFTSRDNVVDTTLKFTRASIGKTWLSETGLLLLHGREKTSAKWIPVEATSTKTGFADGHVWKPLGITIDTTTITGKFSYEVDGILEWTLLGTPIYTELKRYSGFINVKAHSY